MLLSLLAFRSPRTIAETEGKSEKPCDRFVGYSPIISHSLVDVICAACGTLAARQKRRGVKIRGIAVVRMEMACVGGIGGAIFRCESFVFQPQPKVEPI
jgi:hypothetical protein